MVIPLCHPANVVWSFARYACGIRPIEPRFHKQHDALQPDAPSDAISI
ncbi:MAG: hypothetical protein WBL07_11345 [Thiothrix litoralis]